MSRDSGMQSKYAGNISAMRKEACSDGQHAQILKIPDGDMKSSWPSDSELRKRLSQLIGFPRRKNAPFIIDWKGTTYRFAAKDFADRERFTDGEGARRNGGRFTPIGSHRTVYLSKDRSTATAELNSWFEYYNVPDSAFQPRVLAAVGVTVHLLLDLTSSETLAELKLTEDSIKQEWRSHADRGEVAAPQLFGRLAYEMGFEGICFSSVRRDGGVNFALFPDNFTQDSDVVMLHG